MKVDIAIAFDENYLGPFYALLESLIANAGDLHLHLIVTGVDEDSLTLIKSYTSTLDICTTFYEINDSQLESFVTRDKWTAAVYYRLYFPLLVDASVERLLYLDTDTIVLKNLKDFFTRPLDGFPVAAVYDNYVKVQPLIGIVSPGMYFNSGVLLIDVAKWREQEVSQRAIGYLRRYPERILYVDQCALNAVLRNNWLAVESKFNFLHSYLQLEISSKMIPSILAEVFIVHYNLDRPWLMLCKNRLRRQFRKYLKRSPIYGGRVLIDASIKKVPAWIYIRIAEFYMDHDWLKLIWRKLRLKS